MKKYLARFYLLVAVLFAIDTVSAWQPVVNEVYVDDNGQLSQNPVILHQPEVRNWLADPDYTNSCRRYAYKDMPMITEIVRGGEVQCFTNLCPGSNYTWSVGGFHGTFTTECQYPRSLVAKIGDGRYGYVRNFRDLGGLRLINSSKRTKFGVYFRSEKWELHYQNDQRQGNPMHSEFGIKSEIDLRYQDKEVGAEIVDAEGNVIAYNSETTNTLYTEKYRFVKDWFKSSYSAGYEFTTSPSLPAGDGSVRYFMCSLAEGAINRNYNTKFISNISRVFSVLGNPDMLPSLFHCTSGKDRTGWVAILIEALCGVREADIRRDYLLSYFSGVGYPSASYEGELKGQLYPGNHYNDGYDYGDKYGTSLAGRARSYLERFGVTYEQIKTITMSLVGETPEQVLARVTNAADPDEPDELNGTVTVGIPRAGTKVTNPTVLARGGDEVYQISQNGVDYFVHYFTNTTSALVFTNNSDRAFDVSYLVVGGGGAGGATADGAFGGGGGAGGGVSASANTVTMAVNEKWTVTVGRGGRAAGTGVSASAATGSTVVGSSGNIASASAGSTGGNASGTGAGAGGGTSGGSSVTSGGLGLAGGGAGAAGGGQTPSVNATSGSGGAGVFSAITGFNLAYGAGGGGGGGTTVDKNSLPYGSSVGGDNEGVIPGDGANGGGRGGAFQIKVDFRSGKFSSTVYQLTSAQDGVCGTGGGGGGAGASGANSDSTKKLGSNSTSIEIIGGNDDNGTKVRAGDGGDGVVILRYAASDSEEASAFDPNLKHENPDVNESEYTWYDLSYFMSNGFYEGLAFTSDGSPVRLPDGITADNVTGGAHKTDLAGAQLRFQAKGKFVIKWQPPNDGVDYEHPYMSPTPVSGVDVYEYKDGSWRYKTSGRVNFTNKPTMIVVDWAGDWRPCLINLPLLNHFGSFSIGFKNAPQSNPARSNSITKPVVFYGGSAVQGVGAARPGLAYVNIVGRELDVPVVNLGLQNGGRMEAAMAAAAASIDASCFVIDCLAEMTDDEVANRYESFLSTLHSTRPSTPIVLVEAYDAYGSSSRTAKESTVWDIYQSHKSDWNLVYMPKSQLTKGDGEGIFLNGYLDTIGMREMADALDDVLSTTLGISRSVPKRQAFIDYTTGVSADWKIDNSEFDTPTFDFATACAHATTEDDVRWFDGKDLPLEGCAFTDVERYFDRYPATLSTDMTMDGGRVLQRDTASEQFRFRTDSSQLRIKWKTYDNELSLFQMPMTSCSGIDVYRFDETSGKWVYKTSGTVTAWRETELVTDWTPGEACLINLPLYNGIDHIKIGLDASAEIEALGTRASGVNKPVVIYGTSITQGNAPSRPGLAFVNRVGRDLDIPVVNLGFSGSGVMEPQVVEHLAGIDASCYVIDSIWNLRSVENICDKYKPFVRELRRLRPDVPIVLAGMAYAWGGTPDPYEQEVIDFYNELVSEGWKGIYFLPKTEMYPSNYYDSTVDGTHPTDEGMETMAMAYGAAIQRALITTTYDDSAIELDESTRLASGGDRVYAKEIDGEYYWIHEFTTTAAAKTFQSVSSEAFDVNYLVVGGGGAGGDGWDNLGGGGGGGGGGVCESTATMSAGAKWSVYVGKGGTSSGARSAARGVAGASAITNGTAEVVTVLGGGAGGCVSGAYPTVGAAGGGGSGRGGADRHEYAEGNFGGSHHGGYGHFKYSKSNTAGGAGGGGGAGGNGVDGTLTVSGNGGQGVSSSITGSTVEYGGGGGGAGTASVTPGTGSSGGGKGGTDSAPGASGSLGTGGGGGGGYGTGGDGSTASAAGAGGSGIVIIRYKAGTPPAPTYTVTFSTNNNQIVKTLSDVADGYEVQSSDLPVLTGGSWDKNPVGAVIHANTNFTYTIDSPEPGPTPSGDVQLATGGDYIHMKEIGGVNYWIHEFSNGTANVTFENTSGKSLEVEYLVVGGGGAGGDGYDGYCSGGGGGGGVVTGNDEISPDEPWFIYVGKGGHIKGTINTASESSCGSAISNANSQIAWAPGGGSGASANGGDKATSGASGGGAASGNATSPGTGMSGYGHNGGTTLSGKDYGGGGGGGAAAAGGNGTSTKSGDGGDGVASSIAGVEIYYGCGGGGSGKLTTISSGKGGSNGASGGNGSTGTGAQSGVDGTGCGGGGAYNNTTSASGTQSHAGNGGDGIVIIRYVAGVSEPEPAMCTVTFISNTVEQTSVEIEKDAQLAADKIPDFGRGEWDSNPTNATIVADTDFNFTSIWKVTFLSNGVEKASVRVLNGQSLSSDDIPDFGSGTWDNEPSSSITVTGDMTFSFTPDDPTPPGPAPEGRLATGGDYVHMENIGGVNYWIHEFSNGTASVTFENTSGASLPVEYLVVGGGGAGGGGFSGIPGAGGGGGGVIHVTDGEMPVGSTWSIYVGKGGSVMNGTSRITMKTARIPAGASAISNNTATAVAYAPGGGAGGTAHATDYKPTVPATSGGSGGGAARDSNYTPGDGEPGLGHVGGKAYNTKDKSLGAGGGGGYATAGGDGGSDFSGNGGDGLACSITGTQVYYGCGGGGSCGNGITAGKGGNNGESGGKGGTEADSSAQDGVAGTGCGGGGGLSSQSSGGTPDYSGNGGSGIVIIRYVAGTAPDPEPVMCTVTFTSNAVEQTSVEIEKNAQLAADKIPDFGRGEWDSNPTNATIVADTNFNFTSIWKVTFSTNGVNVAGTESTARNGEAPAVVPAFTDGSWDVDPSAADVICDTNFNYTIAAEPPPAVEMPFAVIGTDTDSVISFTGSVTEDHLVDGKVYVRAGETQTLGAVDTTGKTCCGCWRDDATGELFWGETVEVTPSVPTTYTACFGPKWDLWYDTTNKYYHLDNGIWDFKAEITNGDEIIVGKFVGDSSRFTDDGQLRLVNFATPVEGTGFSGLKIAYFSNYTTEPTTGYAEIFEKSTDSTRVHRNDYKLPEMLLLPDTTKEIDVMAFKNLVNIRGVLCIPENVKIYHQAFASDGSLEGLIFKGGVDGGQTFEDKTYLISKNKENPNVLKDHASTGNQFEQCHRLAGGVVLPRSITYIPPNCFYWCESLGAIDLTYVTNVMDRGLYNCHSLSNVVALESLESVGFMACCGCYSLAGDLNFTNLKTEAFCAFGNCGITSVKLPKVTTINYGLFVNTPVTNIVFSEQAVTFACNEDDDKPQWPYESDELGKAYCTNAISTRCWLEFPGAAPILTNFANRTTALWLFGVRNSEDGQPQDKIMPELCLHGEFERDREGWEKIYAEIGNPMPYNSERPKQSIPDDIGVYGFVNWQDEYEFTKDKIGNVLSQGFTPSTTKAYLVFTLKGLYFFVK